VTHSSVAGNDDLTGLASNHTSKNAGFVSAP